MNRRPKITATIRRLSSLSARGILALVFGLAAVAGLGILTMMLVTTLDVILRIFGSTFIGAFDIVKIAGALTIACAIPYTTAVKGHVAIEYFFHKLSRRGRAVADTLTRSASIVLFAALFRQSIMYGLALKRTGQVTSTLQIPIYWVAYIIALSCAVVVLVILHNMLHPGKRMIEP